MRERFREMNARGGGKEHERKRGREIRGRGRVGKL